MDYCKDGDLKKYLRIKKKLPDLEASEIMRQVVTGYQ
jgi:serine/threonine protein kinase